MNNFKVALLKVKIDLQKKQLEQLLMAPIGTAQEEAERKEIITSLYESLDQNILELNKILNNE
ncbi:MAG: hypothetical protein AAF849_04905 [Bacteroidota bacterium]